jgi:hypothetical protein
LRLAVNNGYGILCGREVAIKLHLNGRALINEQWGGCWEFLSVQTFAVHTLLASTLLSN